MHKDRSICQRMIINVKHIIRTEDFISVILYSWASVNMIRDTLGKYQLMCSHTQLNPIWNRLYYMQTKTSVWNPKIGRKFYKVNLEKFHIKKRCHFVCTSVDSMNKKIPMVSPAKEEIKLSCIKNRRAERHMSGFQFYHSLVCVKANI